MRRYYAELEAASAASGTLKAVLMGPGEAGKTSLLRRLALICAGAVAVFAVIVGMARRR